MPLALLLAACGVSDDASDDIDANEDDIRLAVTFSETTATALVDQACGTGTGRGCYTNHAVTADLDGDGKLDLVMANGGGHFTAGAPEPQAVFFGDGAGTFANAAASFPGIALSLVRQVAVADFDGDGRLDVYFPAGYGSTDDQLFMQVAERSFENQPQRVGAGRSRAGAAHAGDIDNDGDVDLVIADWGTQPNPDSGVPASAVTVRVLVNDGRGNFAPGAVLQAPGGSSATDIDLQDVNGDFALDIVLTQRNGQSRLYFNDGKGAFTDVTLTKAFPRKQGPFTFNAELCDLDNDGDLDLLFDGGARSLANQATQLLTNDGTGTFVDETTRIMGEPRSDDNQVKCVDVDNDGDYDLIVASLTNPSEKLLRNSRKTGLFNLVPNAFPRLGDPTLSVDVGDFDGDGRIDLMTAQGEINGRPFLDRIFKNNVATTDTRPPHFRAVERAVAVAGASTAIRLAVTDAYTSETGQHVKEVALEVTVAGVASKVVAQFMGGDVFRAVLPPLAAGATVTVRPRAVDRAGNTATGPSFDVIVPPAARK